MAFCTNCGTKIESGKFCPNCGTPVYRPAAPTAEAPAPAVEAPMYAAPVVEEPVYNAPVVEEPVYTAPVAEEPVYTAPVVEEPVYTAPVIEEPVYTAPVIEEPAPVVEEEVSEVITGSYTFPTAAAQPVQPPVQQYQPPVQQYQQPQQQYQQPVQQYQSPVQQPAQPQYQAPVQHKPVKQPKASGQGGKKKALPFIIGGAVALVVLIVVLALVLGGKGKNDVTGVYQGHSIDMFGEIVSMNDVYEGDSAIELKKGGEAFFTLDGDTMPCEWELTDTEFLLTLQDIRCPGTLIDGVLTIDYMEMGMMMTFAREGAEVPEITPSTGSDTDNEPSLFGTYPLYSAVIGGHETPYASLQQSGLDQGYVAFNDDGTGEYLFGGGDALSFTYTYNGFDEGTITFANGDESPFTVDFDHITVEFPTQNMVMTHVYEYSDVWIGADEHDPEYEPQVPTITIENPSDWYGWFAFSEYWGDTAFTDDMKDGWAIVRTDSVNSTAYFEVYQSPERDGGPVFSMYCEVEDGMKIVPIVGEEDAWIRDEYLDPAEDNSAYTGLLLPNDTLVFEFPYESPNGFGCDVVMCFRPVDALWDTENDILPPGLSAGSDVPEPPAPSAPALTGGEITCTIEEFWSDATKTVTFTLPDSGFVVDNNYSSTAYIYNVPTLDDAYSDSPRIQFELKGSLDDVNTYIDSMENLKEIDGRTVGGAALKGRTYKQYGMEWTEFYGQLPDGLFLVVKISGVDIAPGSEGAAILDSVSIG